jgi:putative flippase GtrA
MKLAIEIFIMHYLPAQMIATGPVLIWNFTGNYMWTFRKESHASRF